MAVRMDRLISRMASERTPRISPLTRLEEALETLREAGEPGYGSSTFEGRGSGNAEWAAPDQARAGWRKLYGKFLKRVDRLASDVSKALGRDVEEPAPKKKCVSCRRFMREEAVFCESCGVKQPERS